MANPPISILGTKLFTNKVIIKGEYGKNAIYVGEELTKDSFILKHKGFYTSEQLSRIETGISDYDEIKENFIDLDEYSENR